MPQQPRSNGIVLQPRDYALLQGFLDSRLLRLKHAAVLHFDGKPEAAKKRLQKLLAAGLVSQRVRRPQEPAIYTLGREGYLRLKQAGLLDPSDDRGWIKIQKRQRIGDLMLQHELAVLDVKTAFITAIGNHSQLELVEMSVAPDRHQFRVVEAVPAPGGGVRFRSLFAKPDGFLHFRQRREDGSMADRFFFLEVDRGTEPLGRLLQKSRHYTQYYRKGGFAIRLGQRREEFRRFPFRVLMIFKSALRVTNAVTKLARPGGGRKWQVAFTTMNELLSSPLKAIGIIDGAAQPRPEKRATSQLRNRH